MPIKPAVVDSINELLYRAPIALNHYTDAAYSYWFWYGLVSIFGLMYTIWDVVCTERTGLLVYLGGLCLCHWAGKIILEMTWHPVVYINSLVVVGYIGLFIMGCVLSHWFFLTLLILLPFVHVVYLWYSQTLRCHPFYILRFQLDWIIPEPTLTDIDTNNVQKLQVIHELREQRQKQRDLIYFPAISPALPQTVNKV